MSTQIVHWSFESLLRLNRGNSHFSYHPPQCNNTYNNMSNSSTQSGSSIPSMVTSCKNATDLAQWMVKQAPWQKKKVTTLSKKSLGNLQNMCTVQSAFLNNAHFIILSSHCNSIMNRNTLPQLARVRNQYVSIQCICVCSRL